MSPAKTGIGCLKSALIMGVSWLVLGYIGPIILAPSANQGPLLGIFITGPAGFLLGGLIGLGVGLVKQYNESHKDTKSGILSGIPKVWNWILWGNAIFAAVVIVAGIIYIPWYDKKYSHIVNTSTDLQRRDKALTSLSVRFLSDADLIQLQQFRHLNYLDFFAGWGLGEAKLTDAGLKNLSELDLPELEWLMLGYCNKITDEGMQYIARTKSLKYLSLSACSNLTDDGLLKLTSLAGIETLDLRGCMGITDRGLGHLKKMPKLKEVLLGGCINVTGAGMDELRKALPHCRVTKNDQEWAWHSIK